MNSKKVMGILMILFLSFSAQLFAEYKMRLAIVDFEAQGVSRDNAKKISELVRNGLINTRKYTVIERTQVDKILREQGFQYTGCTDVSCAVKMGQLLSARKMLVGTVMKLGNKTIITGRIIDVEKGSADFSEKATAETEQDLERAVDDYVLKLSVKISKYQGSDSHKPKGAGTRGGTDYIPYGASSLVFLISSLGVAGTGIYYNFKLADANDRYRKDYQWYTISNNMLVATMYHVKLAVDKKDSDKHQKNRNICLGVAGGVGAVGITLGIVWLVKYLGAERAVKTGGSYDNPYSLQPIAYAYPSFNTNKSVGWNYGLGLTGQF